MSFNPIYDDKKEGDSINLGPKKIINGDGKTCRMLDLIITEPEKTIVSIKEKDVEVLYETTGGEQKICCWLYEHPITEKRSFNSIRIARTSSNGHVYGNQEITLYPDTLDKLLHFISNRKLINTSNRKPFSIPYEEFKKLSENRDKIYNLLSQTPKEELKKILENIDNIDYIAKISNLKQKEKALEKLNKIINGEYENEKDIEKFLEKNLWMLGNEFSIFISEKKINNKNILDIFPKNYEGFADIIELKLPKEKLFEYDTSHENYYPNNKLTKAIAQLQNYLFELEKQTENEEKENKYNCRIIKPKGIILYGTIEKLNDDEKKFLRILNSSYHNITIYTYQQLYIKAFNTLNYLIKKNN